MEALSAGGRGVGRSDGRVWFLPGAFPGDVVLAEPRVVRPRFVEGSVVRTLHRSAMRREPPCPLQESCGGCPWMPIDEAEQRKWKERVLRDALERLAGIEAPPVDPILAPSDPLGYRNRMEFTLGTDRAGRPAVGFHAAEPDRGLVDIDRCPLQHDSANDVLHLAREFLLDTDREPAENGIERARHRLVLRRSSATGRILVALRGSGGPFPRDRKLAEHLHAVHERVGGVVRVRARAGRRGGARVIRLVGDPWLEERVAGQTFRLPADTFTQVSGAAAAEIARQVESLAGPMDGRDVLDLYGGIGATSFALARAGARRATVCDADRAATRCGIAAARRAGVRGLTFVHDRVDRFLRDRSRGTLRADVIVANPPRAGLGPSVVEGILHEHPRRLVIVSCDPATLARDLSGLIEGGFLLERVVPLDVFPQTAHVESVAALRRLGDRGSGNRGQQPLRHQRSVEIQP